MPQAESIRILYANTRLLYRFAVRLRVAVDGSHHQWRCGVGPQFLLMDKGSSTALFHTEID
jgi:hypothetical protein